MPSPGTSLRKDESRRYYEKHRDKILAKRKQQRKTGQLSDVKRSRMARDYRMVAAVKETCGCQDCGRQLPAYALDLDHVRGEKDCNVSKLVGQGAARARILAEIDKCEVVCATCHRLRTLVRKYGQLSDFLGGPLSIM